MIKGLDAFRAIAFFLVFMFHMNLLGCGYLGVDAFFVLSGFLITPILLNLKKNNTLGNYLKVFYGRRFLRIFPLYYAYLAALLIVLYAFGKQHDDYYSSVIAQLPYAFTYTYDFLSVTKYSSHNYIITHFWSLAVEEQFYLVWPFFIFFIKEKYLKKWMTAIIFSGILLRYITFNLTLLPQFNFFTNSDLVIYVSPFSYVDAFVMGGYFSVFGNAIKVNKKIILSIFILIVAAGILTSKAALNSYHFNAIGYYPFMNDSAKYLWGYTAFAIFFSYILLGLKRRVFFPVIFENKVLAYLGKISYGLYIFHFPAIYLCGGLWGGKTIPVFISALLLTIFISVLSFELFEKKINKLKDKFFAY